MNARVNLKTDITDHISLVYVMGCKPEGPVKIGMTSQIGERHRAIQVASPHKVKIFGVRFASSRPTSGNWKLKAMFRTGAGELERAVHRRMQKAGKQLNGEWFDVSAGTALATIDQVGQDVGPRAVGLEQLLGADLTGRADQAMEKMLALLTHEALALNLFIDRINQG